MKYKALLSTVMIAILLIARIGTAFAVSGTNASVETFHVHANNGNAYIKLKSTKGVAYVEKHSIWGTNPITGYEEENTHGFYYVKVEGPGKNETIRWVPSVTTTIDLLGSGFESGAVLKISFSYSGDYTITVEPMDNRYASNQY